MALQSEIRISGGYTFGAVTPTAGDRFGNPSSAAGLIEFADGTGAGQANQVFQANLSITSGSTQSYDLRGGGGELDVLNVALAMTSLKLLYLEITTPASGTSLRFGPQGVSNTAVLWFNDRTANYWQEVFDKLLVADPRAGWTIGAGTSVIAIKNPGASTVTGKLWVIGTK